MASKKPISLYRIKVIIIIIMVEWLFSLLFYCECGINQNAGQKTLV